MLHSFLPSLAELWLSLTTIVILQGIALYTWQFRKEPGARWQSYVQVCKGLWLFSILMIVQSSSQVQRDAWHSFYTLLALSVCYFWLRCIAEISGADRRFASWFLPAVRFCMGVFLLFVATNSWHHWYWRSVDAVNGVTRVQTAPIGYLALLFGYGQIGYSLWLNIVWARSCKGLRRRQAWLFVLPTLAAWTGQFLGYLPHSREFEPHTIGFLSASLLMAWAFLRWRAYSILPLAEKTLVQNLADAVMVIDESGSIVALNEHGQTLFDGAGVQVGASLDAVFAVWPELRQAMSEEATSPFEASYANRQFLLHLTPLRTQDSQLLGHVLHFKDVTIERQQQQRIVEQQKSLAALHEREQLGRELHDGPGQMWSFLAAQTQATRLLLKREKYAQADQTLGQLQQIIQEVYSGLRESISNRQSGIRDGLPAALETQLGWCREYCALDTELLFDAPWQDELLTPTVQAQTLRILQEALANVRKSAHATKVRIRVSQQDGLLLFSVEDDGCGFETAQVAGERGRHGLSIMRDRAREISAELRIESQLGAGTTILLKVPLSESISLEKAKASEAPAS